MLESEQLREQSLSILKEQTTKLKIQSKDIQLKDEQIKFLKETILTLEQEKDSVAHHNHQLKQKLKTMAAQISQYNQNVVQKIYQQNQQLINEQVQLQKQLDQQTFSSSSQQKIIIQLQKQLEHQQKQKQDLIQQIQNIKESKLKHQKKINLVEKDNRQLQQKNISLQRQLDESSTQINYCSQQIDILTQKHQDALKHNDKKIKQTIDKMVNKEEYENIQKELKQSLTRNNKIMKELQKRDKEREKNKLQLLTCKQKIITFQVNQQTKSLMLKTDILNLAESIKIGKKITQFESQLHQNMAGLYQQYHQLTQNHHKIKKQLENVLDRNNCLESNLKVAEETLKLMEIELNALRQRRQDQKQSLQAQYESKLMEISIRLRKEEMSLALIKNKQNRLQQLQEQYEEQQQQHKMQRQTLNRTIEQLEKQNKKISEELSSAVRLCQQNMMNRQCIMNYKYVLQDIIAITHYLYNHLIQRKKVVQQLYRPLISQYFRLYKSQKHQKHKPLRKLKRCVHAVVAMIRMKKEASSGGKGLLRYAKDAVERRYNIKNLSEHVEKISCCIIEGGKVEEVLRCSENVYKWKLPQYKRVIFGQSPNPKSGFEQQIYNPGYRQIDLFY